MPEDLHAHHVPHNHRHTGTPDQLMQLAGQIITIARAIKSKEYKP